MSALSLYERFHCADGPRIEEMLTLRTGDRRDYSQLAGHHYRAARPATFMRVLVLEHDQPTVVGRYLNRRSDRQTIGVLVESLPSLACRLREEATGNRYRSIADLRMRAKALNKEIRCISRVVIHPQWRGLGLAVRLVKAALSSATTPLTEAIAAMGHVNPFFEHAGMAAYHAAQGEADARLIAALEVTGFCPTDTAMADAMLLRIASLPTKQHRFITRELERWHRLTMHRHACDMRQQIIDARQWLLCDAVYYLRARDGGTEGWKGRHEGTEAGSVMC